MSDSPSQSDPSSDTLMNYAQFAVESSLRYVGEPLLTGEPDRMLVGVITNAEGVARVKVEGKLRDLARVQQGTIDPRGTWSYSTGGATIQGKFYPTVYFGIQTQDPQGLELIESILSSVRLHLVFVCMIGEINAVVDQQEGGDGQLARVRCLMVDIASDHGSANALMLETTNFVPAQVEFRRIPVVDSDLSPAEAIWRSSRNV